MNLCPIDGKNTLHDTPWKKIMEAGNGPPQFSSTNKSLLVYHLGHGKPRLAADETCSVTVQRERLPGLHWGGLQVSWSA